MISQRIVLAAVAAFAVAWVTLTSLALRSPSTESPAPRALSRDEIARHDRPDDCWIVIRGKVYDVTDYIPSHPAPSQAIADHCGQESTQAFETKDGGRPHSPQAWQMLETYLVGEVGE